MARGLPNLIWLRSFEASARHLNFTLAAEELGLTQAAVSLHIRSLEGHLGTALFRREPRNLSLTEMGTAYLPAVSNALEDLTLSTTGLFGPALQKVVRIRAPLSTVVLWIAPRLHEFHQLHPDVDIRMESFIWADRTTPNEADIDLHLGLPERFPKVTESLSAETISPICHRDHAERYWQPKDLLQAPLIHILGFEDHWARYFSAHDLNPSKAHYAASVDTTTAAMEMVCAGFGLAPVLTRFATLGIEGGKPLYILGESVPLEQEHFLVVKGKSQKEKSEVTDFRNWLRTIFSEAV